LTDLRGKVVLVDFWGVWCGSCIGRLPTLQAIRNKYRDRGFELIGVHTTEHGDKMSPFFLNHEYDWPTAIDISNQTESVYHVKGWPALFLIDRQGILRVAQPHHYQLEEQIQRLLSESVPHAANE
jgi:thiol-disulfide isomerase/thioredoxin